MIAYSELIRELFQPLGDTPKAQFEALKAILQKTKETWKNFENEKPKEPGFYFVVWAKDSYQTYYGHSYYDGKRFVERSSFVSPLAWMDIPEFKASE
jgi:hypothetical protein